MIRADAIRVAATATAVPRAFSPRTSIRRLPRPNIKEKIGTTRRKRRNGELLTWLVAQGIFSSSIYAWETAFPLTAAPTRLLVFPSGIVAAHDPRLWFFHKAGTQSSLQFGFRGT